MRLWIVLALLGWSACEDKGIGLPCGNSGGQAGGAATSTSITSEAVECPKSICLQMSGRPDRLPVDCVPGGSTACRTQPVAYCSATCSSDSDCEGGQNCWSADGTRRMPFRCLKPQLLPDDSGLCCKGVCVCEYDGRRQDNPVLMKPVANCQSSDPQNECNYTSVEPSQCLPEHVEQQCTPSVRQDAGVPPDAGPDAPPPDVGPDVPQDAAPPDACVYVDNGTDGCP
jgi:hypothetical protein